MHARDQSNAGSVLYTQRLGKVSQLGLLLLREKVRYPRHGDGRDDERVRQEGSCGFGDDAIQ